MPLPLPPPPHAAPPSTSCPPCPAAPRRTPAAQRRDRVAVWAPNCAEWVTLQYGAARAGAVLVNLNPSLKAAELAYALRKAGAVALVLAPELRGTSFVDELESVRCAQGGAGGEGAECGAGGRRCQRGCRRGCRLAHARRTPASSKQACDRCLGTPCAGNSCPCCGIASCWDRTPPKVA